MEKTGQLPVKLVALIGEREQERIDIRRIFSEYAQIPLPPPPPYASQDERVLHRDLCLALKCLGDCPEPRVDLCQEVLWDYLRVIFHPDHGLRIKSLRDYLLRKEVLQVIFLVPQIANFAIPILTALIRHEDRKIAECAIRIVLWAIENDYIRFDEQSVPSQRFL